MRIISCEECGAVLDLDRISKPDIYHTNQSGLIKGNSVWDGDEYQAVITCPCCDSIIFYETGEIIPH